MARKWERVYSWVVGGVGLDSVWGMDSVLPPPPSLNPGAGFMAGSLWEAPHVAFALFHMYAVLV